MKIQINNPRPARSLIYTLAVAFLTISVIALLADGAITLYTDINRQQGAILAQQQLIAQDASQEVSGFFEEKYKALEATTKIVELATGVLRQKKLTLESLLATQPSFRQIVLLNSAGGEVTQASRVSLETSRQFATQFQKAISNRDEQSQRYISPIYFDDVTDEPLIVLAVPMNIWGFEGTLAAEMNLQFMWTLVDELKVGKTGYVYLVDNEGNLIAFRDTARVLSGENVKQIRKVNEFMLNSSAVANITPDIKSYVGLSGDQVLGTYVPLGAPQWAVLTELPYAEAYEPIVRTTATTLATILVMGLLAGLAGIIVARRLAKPIIDLTGTATRIANGEIQLQATGGEAKEITSLATAFNTMTSQLRSLIDNLENRVTERTTELEDANKQISRRAAQLQTITELSESIAQLQDPEQLFQTATELISERFGFYHVGIFLIDNDREFAVMQATNSEGGKRMLERNHKLKLGFGVVGYAAQTGQARFALDVGTDAVFFDNPDLPHTRSEVALPLKSRFETIGVLDVQSVETAAFSHEDLQILTALANQVSIALENARLFKETRAALAQVQEVYDEFTRAEWSRAVAKTEQTGFRYHTGRIEMIEGSLNSPGIVSAVKKGQVVTNSGNGSNNSAVTMTVPVKLRGEVIGVLHIESNDTFKKWQTDEISLVEAVAERAAFALENARLFQDARRRAAKERLISEATSKISGALNIENILQTTAQELERVLGGSEVLIRFQTREQK
ncbi:MAG TPA: GAF domain-containing protein [Anaerolineales bacterium]|nr:GAF domain-containing protein [Anaerolineales bacterium]